MDINKDKLDMLDLMLRPAFCVEEGLIRHINPAAGHFMLTAGQPIIPLILSGQEEYEAFAGCMQLQLSIAGQKLDATVIRKDGMDIFLPDPVTKEARFQILSLASMQLREPLAGLATITERLLADADPVYAGQANRRLHQTLRILSNMSDVQRFSNPDQCRMEYTEICSFLEEILEKANTRLENIQIRIQPTLPSSDIYMLLDREQVERSVYNLLSNAAKYSAHGSPIQVQLSQKGQRMHLSVTSRNSGSVSHRDFYDQFLREPSLEDPIQGLGLGLLLVRSTAANHGGAVLIDQPEGHSTRVTMTLSIRPREDFQVQSPIFRMDYTGERDHGLFELADVLPAELYQ